MKLLCWMLGIIIVVFVDEAVVCATDLVILVVVVDEAVVCY